MTESTFPELVSALETLHTSTYNQSVSYPKSFNKIPGAPQIGSNFIGDAIEEEREQIDDFLTSEIDRIFTPWHGSPSPLRFDTAIESIDSAHKQIADEDIVNLKTVGDHSYGAMIPPILDNAETNIHGWQGKAVKEARHYYFDRFSALVYLQANTLTLLKISLQAWKEAVYSSRKAVLDLVTDAKNAIEAIGSCGTDSELEVLLNIATKVAGWLPLSKFAASVTTEGLTLAKSFGVSDPESELPLASNTIGGVWINMESALETIRKTLSDTESELASIIEGYYFGLDAEIKLRKGNNTGDYITERAARLIHLKPLKTKVSESNVEDNVAAPDEGYSEPDPVHDPDPIDNEEDKELEKWGLLTRSWNQ